MKRALLVIDVQKEYFEGKLPISYPADGLVNILGAMDAARTRGVSLIVIQHFAAAADAPAFRRGSTGAELHPEISRRARDLLVEKTCRAVLPAPRSNRGCEPGKSTR